MPVAIKNCRICGNSNLVKVLDLGEQALTGVFPKTKDQVITSGPLQLVKCHVDSADEESCGLLQLAHSYELQEMYGDNYGYRSGLNPSMVRHLHEKVLRILEMVKLEDGDLIIDIGSNDSTTLQAYPNHNCKLVGIDPTGNKFRKFYPPHIELIADFYSSDAVRSRFGELKAKVITSFSMFYDLEEPLSFMQQVAEVLASDGIWVFEQSYMPKMLEQNSYDTVCHEHLEYYSMHQIKWMTDHVGLRIIDVEFNDVNGGSFSVAVAHKSSGYQEYKLLDRILRDETDKALSTLTPYLEFAKRTSNLRTELQEFLQEAKKAGKKVVALGASTKGNVLLQYCDVSEEEISFVGEVNVEKFGCYTPQTLLPIISEEEVLAKNPDYILILPWHFRRHFMEQEKFKRFNLLFPLPTLTVVEKR